MAEDENGAEKTEDPTGKRLEKAREEGNVPRSKDLNMALVMIGGVLAILMFGSNIAKQMEAVAYLGFSIQHEEAFDPGSMLHKVSEAATHAALALAPIFLVLAIAAMIGSIFLSGWNFSTKALQPKFSNLNPINGLKKMFSLNSLVELGKATAKLLVVGTASLVCLNIAEPDLLNLYVTDTRVAIGEVIDILAWVCIVLACSLLLIAAIDVPYQLYDFNKKLKMTKQEVKDEHKDAEGKPEVKGRIRRMQMEMAQRRMMEAVPQADVVITNPTHYSVALKYDTAGSGAPIVVAKGVDVIAFRIREVASANDVEIIESPQLARAVYFTTEIDSEIPSALYMAVAQVLAYVFQLQAHRRGKGRKPRPLKDVNIPPEMQFD